MDLAETCWGLKTVLSWHKKARVCRRLGGLGLMGWSALCRRKSANATQHTKKEEERTQRSDSHVRELTDCNDRSHALSVSRFELGGVKSVNSETRSQARRLPLSPIQRWRCWENTANYSKFKRGEKKKQRNIHIYPARSSCSLTRVSLSRVLPASVRLEIHCASVGLCRCVCADGELMVFFLRKIGLLRETSCNEGRTEGKKVDCAGNGDAARMEIKLLWVEGRK